MRVRRRWGSNIGKGRLPAVRMSLVVMGFATMLAGIAGCTEERTTDSAPPGSTAPAAAASAPLLLPDGSPTQSQCTVVDTQSALSRYDLWFQADGAKQKLSVTTFQSDVESLKRDLAERKAAPGSEFVDRDGRVFEAWSNASPDSDGSVVAVNWLDHDAVVHLSTDRRVTASDLVEQAAKVKPVSHSAFAASCLSKDLDPAVLVAADGARGVVSARYFSGSQVREVVSVAGRSYAVTSFPQPCQTNQGSATASADDQVSVVTVGGQCAQITAEPNQHSADTSVTLGDVGQQLRAATPDQASEILIR